ncbi:MAG: cytochrome c oxidase assembly protein [Rhodovibrionaceae bacterium]|nr:cytochrome c oxidase assembly protein [Rhodovibrionaceae bacterium]
MPEGTKRNNAAIALTLVGVVVGMVGLSFAAVPLYDLFCRVTGFGGTTQEASVVPGETGERVFTVRFNADVNPKLPWDFAPEQRAVQVKAGEQGLAFYIARNLAARPTTGTAVFNVTPAKAGQYFNKTQCFCFDEQRLEPGQQAEMGVSFFVDPAILEDPALADVETITLSYTFFRDLDDLQEQPGEDAKITSENRRAAGEDARHSIN